MYIDFMTLWNINYPAMKYFLVFAFPVTYKVHMENIFGCFILSNDNIFADFF